MRDLRRLDAAVLLAAAPTILVVAWWAADDGGYYPVAWMPGTLALALALGVTALAFRPRVRFSSTALALAATALLAYTAWSFASIAWARAPGSALEGSQRTLLYAIAFAGIAVLPWTPRTVLWLVTAFVLGAMVLAVVTLLRAAALEQPQEIFVNARLSAPLGYYNADAAFWTMAALPAILLAARGETLWPLRPLLLGGAVVLLGLAVLAQSRGWLFSLPVAALVAVVLVPGRLRLVLFALPVALAFAFALDDLLEPYRIGHLVAPNEAAPQMRAALDTTARSLLVAAAFATMAGALLIAAERALRARTRRRSPDRRERPRRLPRAARIGAAFAAIIIVAAAVVAARPLQRLDAAWSDFTTTDASDGRTLKDDRFTSLGGARYDFWRVAVDAWAEHPLQGLGQDNFEDRYTRVRRTDEEPRWAHSLPLRLLVHTGAVGALLFGVFLGALAWALMAGRRRAGPAHRAAVAVAVVPGVTWVAHGSVDWLWEFPALSVPALALAAAAAALGRPGSGTAASAGAESAPAGRPRTVRRAAVVTGVLLVAAVIVPSYVASRGVYEAQRTWRADPVGALDRLARARTLAPLDPRPALVEGLISSQVGRLGASYAALLEARARDPHNWFVQFELGLVAGEQGRPVAARRHLRLARRMNPREPLTREALTRIGGDDPMTVAEAAGSSGRRVDARLGRR